MPPLIPMADILNFTAMFHSVNSHMNVGGSRTRGFLTGHQEVRRTGTFRNLSDPSSKLSKVFACSGPWLLPYCGWKAGLKTMLSQPPSLPAWSVNILLGRSGAVLSNLGFGFCVSHALFLLPYLELCSSATFPPPVWVQLWPPDLPHVRQPWPWATLPTWRTTTQTQEVGKPFRHIFHYVL